MTADLTARKHIEQWVDGVRSLVDIAEGLDKDPLQIAKIYINWIRTNLLVFKTKDREVIAKQKELPSVLCVDDSPVMQISIKRALSDRYQVAIASYVI
jgi:hypothetical protein